MIELSSLAAALSMLAASANASALRGEAIANHGDGANAPACTACHGVGFQGDPATKAPALAGLPASVILERLGHYAGPTGKNPEMRQVATALNPAERQALAAYLSSLPKTSGR